MKRQKDIFDLFKDNQHKLDERPSSEAWRKLENRLDKRQERHSKTIYRQLMAAASVAALIALVAVVSLTFQSKRPNFAQANTHKINVPEQFEDLVVFTDSPENVYGYVNLQRRINQGKHFQEGAPTKRLVIQTSSTPSPYSSNNNTAIAMHTPVKEESKIATKKTLKNNSSKNETAITPKEAPPHTEESLASNTPLAEDTYTSTEELEMDVATEEFAADIAHESYIGLEKVEEIASPSSISTARKKVTKSKRVAKESTTRKAQSAHIGSSSNSASIHQLSQFNWLIGKWQGQVNQQQSVELWSQVNAKSIVGKDYLLINGETVFVDEMKIQTIGDELFYILSLNKNEAPVKYKLTSINDDKIVFENNSIAFPKQVILQKKSATNFSTTLQNQAPVQLNSEQLLYFNQRNNIQKEQVERVMEKMK